jgi:transcriptional regulator with XRE-family HTH domain
MKLKFDYNKLLGRITEKFGSQRAFAEACGFSENTISKKLSGKMAITKNDIINWSKPELLDIAAVEIPEYFFKIKVQEN